MKKKFLFIMLLIATFTIVSCSDIVFDPEGCYITNFENEHKIKLTNMVSSYGTTGFEYGIYEAENGTVKLPVKYAFYVDKSVHFGSIRAYKIIFNNGTDKIEFEFNNGPYNADDYVYIGDYFNGEYDLPMSDTVTLPISFFAEKDSSIIVEIVGFEGEKNEESKLTEAKNMYYRILGNSVLISEYELPIKSNLLLDFKYTDDLPLGKKPDIAEATEKYDISYSNNIFVKYSVDCFVSWQHFLGIINDDNVELHDSYTVIGSRINQNKIRISRYKLTDRAKFDGSVTLNYSGDFSVDFCPDSSTYCVYLWDDNTVLSFDGSPYDDSKKLYATGLILDNVENARIRAEIETKCDVASDKNDGNFDFHAVLKSDEYKHIIAKDKNGEEYEIYITTFTEIFNAFLDIIADTFKSLFKT